MDRRFFKDKSCLEGLTFEIYWSYWIYIVAMIGISIFLIGSLILTFTQDVMCVLFTVACGIMLVYAFALYKTSKNRVFKCVDGTFSYIDDVGQERSWSLDDVTYVYHLPPFGKRTVDSYTICFENKVKVSLNAEFCYGNGFEELVSRIKNADTIKTNSLLA